MIRFSTGMRNYLLGTGAFKEALASCFIDVYSGSQPASADTAPTGTKLATFSVNHDGVTGGTWGTASAGVLDKAAAETWQAVGAVAGSAGWFRFRLAGDLGTTNTTDIRMDGTIAASGSDMDRSDTTIVVGTIYTLDAFPMSLPANT